MDKTQQDVLNYLKTTLELDNLPAVEYSEDAGAYWRIPAGDIDAMRGGRLSPELTEKIFEAYFDGKGVEEDKSSPQSSVDIILSLRAVKSDDKVFGLLNIACSLERTGDLSTDEEAWMPYDRLRSENANPTGATAGDLDDFWKFKRMNSEDLELRAESWQDYLRYAEDLFAFVSRKMDSRPEGSDERLDNAAAYVKLGDHVSSNKATVDLYKGLLNSDSLPPLLQSIMEPQGGQKDAEEIDDDAKGVENMLATHGNMSKSSSLSAAQRRTVHAYAGMNAGDVLAVGDFPNVDKTTMLKAFVADLIVEHAMEEKPAPLVVGSSTSTEAVVDMVDLLSDVVSQKHGVLDSRWLPFEPKSGETAGQSAQPRMLQGIVAYCPAQDAQDGESEPGSFELVEDTRKNGVYARYSRKSAIEAAAETVRESSKSLFKSNPRNVTYVQGKLHKWLTDLDAARQNLIKTVDTTEKEYFALAERAGVKGKLTRNSFEERVSSANEARSSASARLSYWSSIEVDRPIKGVFHKKPSASDEDLIAENKRTDDDFDSTLRTLEDIKNHYRRKMDKQDDAIDEIMAFQDAYNNQERKYLDALQATKSLLDQVDDSEKMSRRIDKFAGEYGPCDKNFLPALDKLLDITVRYAEFWLAMHYYECQWLIDCTTPSKFIHRNMRLQKNEEIQELYWQQITSLAPCFAMTADQLPQYFMLYRKGQKAPDMERIDLLIVDDAEQVSTPHMLASFALAKKAVVIGGASQRTPDWPFTPSIDREIAAESGIAADWEGLREHGLTSSAPSSILRAAFSACTWGDLTT